MNINVFSIKTFSGPFSFNPYLSVLIFISYCLFLLILILMFLKSLMGF